MKKEKAVLSAERCFAWIKTYMATGNCAENGIYERYMIHTGERSDCVRPDCNAEAVRAMLKFRQITKSSENDLYLHHLIEWILSAQITEEHSPVRGAFPFYKADGATWNNPMCRYLYQNDNGKVMLSLLEVYRINKDIRLLNAVRLAADFWCSLQTSEGWFYNAAIPGLQPAHKGPCFSAWLALALTMLATDTGDARYAACGQKAFAYLESLIENNTRIRTTYEIESGEAWRPVSSENAIALYCFTRAWEETGRENYRKNCCSLSQFVVNLQQDAGGICNCDASCSAASQQNQADLCDLVYTQGYALLALTRYAAIEPAYRGPAERLAEFLCRIQCHNESPLWDGTWRGAYSLAGKSWSGRADQGGNLLEEGGMYAVYTGWCCMPIVEGILNTAEPETKEETHGHTCA